MNSKTTFFRDKAFWSKLIRMSAPIIAQNLMLAAVAAADAFMLGSLDQNSMAGVSLATQIQFIQNMLLSSAASGLVVLTAQYWGKKDYDSVNDLFCICLRIGFMLSLVFFAGCIFFPRRLMLFYTNEKELIEVGIKYLRIAGWSYLLTGISQTYLSILKVSEHVKEAALISSCTVILNIILNAIMIFGLMGFPAMGVKGAALATLISRIAEVLAAILLSLRKGYVHPQLHRLLHWNRILTGDYIKVTMPLVGAGLVWGVGFTTYTALIGHLGADATAANSVAAVVRDLICCLTDGLAVAGGIFVGNELGAGRLQEGKIYGERMVNVSFLCGFVSTGLMLLLTPLVVHFVQLSEGAGKHLAGMMVVMAVYMIGRAVNTVTINGVFAAGGDTLFDIYSLAVCMWGIAIPLSAAGTFLFHWPVVLVYAGTCLDEVGKIPWVMLHFKKYKWVKDLTRENTGKA